MIVFTLDALADDSHRRHFIEDPCLTCYGCNRTYEREKRNTLCYKCGRNPFIWQEDLSAYYDACDGDEPIKPTIKIINELHGYDYYDTMEDVYIWSANLESRRDKVEHWLQANRMTYNGLKLRPIGDDRPQEQLFEEWVNDGCIETKWGNKDNIEMVFSSHEPTIDMFRVMGVFVFDCNQGE